MHEILVIGIATVDAIARPVEALPKPGGLRFFDELTIATGGCAVNCAIALAKLGVGCEVIARVGADMLGDFVIAELARHRLSTDLIARDSQRTTSFSFAAVGSAGERSFLHTTGANATISRADVPGPRLRHRKLVFITGAMLMDAFDGEQTALILREARSHGARTMLDTVYVEGAPEEQWRSRVWPALAQLDYFIPSQPEAAALSGSQDASAAARMFQEAGARNVVIKLGERGVLYRDQTGSEAQVPAFPVPAVVDATGAGDCWAAGFIAGLIKESPIGDAARLGNAVAAMGIQAPGAATGVGTLADAHALMARSGPPSP